LSLLGGSNPATGFSRPIFQEAGFKQVPTHVPTFITPAVQANGVAALKIVPSHHQNHHQNAIGGLSASGVLATPQVVGVPSTTEGWATPQVVAHAVAPPVAAGVTPAIYPISGPPIHSIYGPPYMPAQIKQAYGFDQVSFTRSLSLNGHPIYFTVPGDGSGQTIAIVDAYDDPSIFSDVNTFDQTFSVSQYDSRSLYNAYGSSSSWLTKVTPEGTPPVSSVWSPEIALDVEWAHAIAPGAKIMLIEAKSAYDSDMYGAVDYARRQSGVGVVSMSWGRGEFSGETSYDGYFTSQNGQGITFIASSGDFPGVQYPSGSPNVLAIGGTSLYLNGNSYNSESIWGSSGGGVSAYEPKPSYQVYISGSMRAVPDAAYDADPNTGFYVYDRTGGSGWYAVGGTSAGAPQWAALIAIANEGRAWNGLGTLNGPTQTLPAVEEYLPLSDFHFIGGHYNTQTGWGTPVANKMIYDLTSNTYV
jgi:subtilase family serine protease